MAKECFGRKYNIMSYVLMKGKNTGNKVGPRPKKRKMDEEDVSFSLTLFQKCNKFYNSSFFSKRDDLFINNFMVFEFS